MTEELTRRNVVDAFRRRMPAVYDNLIAIVARGFPKDVIIEKVKESTPVEAPDAIWIAMDWTIDYIKEDIDGTKQK